MSDYSITKKTGTYPTGLPEIKVGEYEETQIIYGEDCLADILEWLIEYTEYDADPSHRNKLKEAADTIEALRVENAKLTEALKQIYDAVDFPEDTLRRKIRAARAAMGESDE